MASRRDVNNSRAIAAGLLGVVILGLFLGTLAPRLGLGRLDYPRLFGTYMLAAFGLPECRHVILVGWTVFALWGIGWALFYAFYFSDRLPFPRWLQGLIYAGGVVFLISSTVLFLGLSWTPPLISAGQTPVPGFLGSSLSAGRIIMANFLGHCLFGSMLGLVYRRRFVF